MKLLPVAPRTGRKLDAKVTAIWQAEAHALHFGIENEGVLAPIAIRSAAAFRNWTGLNVFLEHEHWLVTETSSDGVRLQKRDLPGLPRVHLTLRRIPD